MRWFRPSVSDIRVVAGIFAAAALLTIWALVEELLIDPSYTTKQFGYGVYMFGRFVKGWPAVVSQILFFAWYSYLAIGLWRLSEWSRRITIAWACYLIFIGLRGLGSKVGIPLVLLSMLLLNILITRRRFFTKP